MDAKQAPSGRDLVFRRVTARDIKSLLLLCRQCFPATLRWQAGFGAGRIWWRSAIQCDAVEIWAAEDRGEIAGYVLLVTDEPRWNTAKRSRLGSTLLGLSALCHPRYPAGRARMSGTRAQGTGPAPTGDTASGRRPGRDERVWLEQIVVAPSCQGQGLGSRLLAFCEERAGQLGRQGVMLRVDSGNAAATGLYRKCGYAQVSNDANNSIYVKMVSGQGPR